MRPVPFYKPKSGKNTTLDVDAIRSDQTFQVRLNGTDEEYAQDLAEIVKSGKVKLPRIKVMRVTDDRASGDFIFDGMHTHKAYKLAGKKVIPVTLYTGDMDDLQQAAAQSNREHESAGLKLSRADKRRAVLMLAHRYKDKPAHLQLSHLQLAKEIGVSHTFVNNVDPYGRAKKKVEKPDPSDPEPEELGAGGEEAEDEDGRGVPAAAKKPADKAANLFDWEGTEQKLASLIRAVDTLAETYGLLRTPEHVGAINAINTAAEHFANWKKKHGKAKMRN